MINATTGKPQAGVVVNLIHPGENGMQTLGDRDHRTPTADSRSIKPCPLRRRCCEATYQDVDYNQVVPPGTPSTGLKLSVYNATSRPASDLAQQHLIVIEPATDALQINETFLLQNTGKTTLLDPVKGSVQFYLPKAAQGSAKVTIERSERHAHHQGSREDRAGRTSSKSVIRSSRARPSYDVGYMLPAAKKFTGRCWERAATIIDRRKR